MNWFIFQCRRSLEVKAKAELKALGLDVLLPMGKKYVARRGRHKRKDAGQAITYPLWSGYIIGGSEHVPWLDLAKRFDNPNCSLIRPVQIDGVAYALGPSLIEEIRNRSWVDLAPFQEGDSVEVNSGPFTGYTGRLVELNDSEAVIMLDMLGKSVKAKYQPSHLTKAA